MYTCRALVSLCEVEEGRRLIERELDEAKSLHTQETAARKSAEEGRDASEAREKR